MGKNNETFTLERALGFLVNRPAYLMSENISKRFKKVGYILTARDFGILYHLKKNDGIPQIKVAELMMRDKTTITRRLDTLVEKGLVERRMDTQDRRRFCIHLTAFGIQAYSNLAPIVENFQVELLAGVSDEEKNISLKVLQQITEKLSNNIENRSES